MLDGNSNISNEQSGMISLYSFSYTKSRKQDLAKPDHMSTDTPQKNRGIGTHMIHLENLRM
jgi:hypothetical protein